MTGMDAAFAPRERVLAAVSGGADSVALLWMLHQLQLSGRIELIAAHFDHGIRGEASRADAEFVRRLCDDLAVPLIEGNADVPALARARRVGLEQAARDARYAFLRQAKADAGADVIALAHHMDDQVETVLMHLARGCGPGGMAGMAARQGDLARPLLGLRKRELVAYLVDRGLSWREDATNAVADTPRNAIRLQVLPPLERAYPGAVAAIARHAALAADEDDLVGALAADFIGERLRPLPLGGWALALDPPGHRAIVRRAIRGMSDLDAAWVERLMDLAGAGGGAAEPPGGLRAEVAGGRLFLFPRERPLPPPAALSAHGRTELGALGAIEAQPSPAVPERADRWAQVLDAGALSGAVVRTRQPGDFIRPLGAGGRMSLSDYLINRRIPRPLRDLIALVAVGPEVLWVAGLGISQLAALGEATSRATRLTFLGERWV